MMEHNEIQEETLAYPGRFQSFGIVAMVIAFMLLFSPIVVIAHFNIEFSFLVYYLACMGLSFWIVHKKKVKYEGSEFKYNFKGIGIKMGVLLAVVTIAIQIGILRPVSSMIPMPDFFRDIFLQMSTRNGLFSFIYIVIAAPILEELIFRGVILDGLLKKYSVKYSILFSAFLFGLVHLNPWQFIAGFVLGILMGWVYYRTKNLLLCILIHFFNNLFAFSSAFFINAEEMMDMTLVEFYGGTMNTILITSSGILITLFGIYLLNEILKKEATVKIAVETSDALTKSSLSGEDDSF